MKAIPPDESAKANPSDSLELVRLAQRFGGKMTVQCPHCKEHVKLACENRTLRLGSSPDMSAIDKTQTSKPRLIFYCLKCQRNIGYIQADVWSPDAGDANDGGAADTPGR